ncbi:MAG: stage IV sporulation protein A [Clostridia bacterium]|nr:stage IV sporulation protein A [Clostridia bacterium]
MVSSIYKDIETRTGGDIYIGVVGPVRTGKSTFIKKFMDTLVIPNIGNEYDRKRAKDELPQSASGRQVTTTEPKFIPATAVGITLDGGASLDVKMIDCVGYMVNGAVSDVEGGEARAVMTPWSTEPMPFDRAAEIGTQKVIADHSTIGVLVTCDGSFGEINRDSFVQAEERVVGELRALGKPFVIVLNSQAPSSQRSTDLALELEEKYGAPVALVNCLELDAEDIRNILQLVLLEFPVTEISVALPPFMSAMDGDHPLSKAVRADVLACAEKVRRVGDIESSFSALGGKDGIEKAAVVAVDLGTGKAKVELTPEEGLFYRIVGEMTGFDVSDDGALISLLYELSSVKRKYDKVAAALDEVNETGYGIVVPDMDDLTLEEPQLTKQAGGYGVKLRASAPSVHMIKANINTEVSPIVGTEQQSEELVRFMLSEFEKDPRRLWDTNIFGKSLYDLINESIKNKLSHVPDESREKLCDTLSRVINEGSSGLLCIIL